MKDRDRWCPVVGALVVAAGTWVGFDGSLDPAKHEEPDVWEEYDDCGQPCSHRDDENPYDIEEVASWLRDT